MKKLMIAAVAVLLMSGTAFSQDDKAAQKAMKKEAKAMKKEAKKAGDGMQADSAKAMKHMHKKMKTS